MNSQNSELAQKNMIPKGLEEAIIKMSFMHWRRKWQPTPVSLPGESQGHGEPGGLPSMGSHRVGHD